MLMDFNQTQNHLLYGVYSLDLCLSSGVGREGKEEEDGNRSSFHNVLSSDIEFQMMNKAHKPSDSELYAP
jgi:hypothetical protein